MSEESPQNANDQPMTEDPRGRQGNSVLLLAVVLLVALLLIGAGIFFMTQTGKDREEQEQQITEVTQLFEETKQRQREKLESGDAVGAGKMAEEDLASIAAKMTEAQESFSGDDAKVFQATNTLISQTRQHLAEYNQVVAELYESGLVRAETLNSVEDIQERRELVLKFRNVNKKFQDYQMNAAENFRELLQENGLKPATVQEAMGGFMASYKPQQELIKTVRRSDEAFAVLLLRVLDLLENNWGQWNYDSAEGGLNFENASVATEYEETLQKLEKVAAIQARAQQQLLASEQPAAATAPTAPTAGFEPRGKQQAQPAPAE